MSSTALLHAHRSRRAHPWCRGAADFLPLYPWQKRTLPIGVRCRLGRLEETSIAMLDTGATYSMIGEDYLEDLEAQWGELEGRIEIATCVSTVKVELRRLPITLLAQPGWGQDMTVTSTCAVSKDWLGPPVIGFHFLQQIQLAMDPGVDSSTPPMIFFGPLS